MPELIARISNKDLPSNLKERYSSIEHIKVAGRIAIYGIEKGSKKKIRIGTKKFIESYGKNATKKPKPAKAVWGNAHGAEPITVVGSYGLVGNGVELMKVKGSESGIARTELIWLRDEEETDLNNVWQSQITDLTARNVDLASRVERLEARLDEVIAANERLQNRNAELESRNQELEQQLLDYKTGALPIVSIPTQHENHNRFKRSFNRTFGWIGSHLPGQREAIHDSARITEQDGTSVITVEEEWYDGYPGYYRRRGAVAVLATVAAVGAAVLVAGLWGEHEEQEGRQAQIHKTEIVQEQNRDLWAELRADRTKLAAANAARAALKLVQAREEATEKAEQRVEEKAETKSPKHSEEFYVEPGGGITTEIQDYARAHGYNEVSGGQAWMIYQNMRQRFGVDLVELPDGGRDTYIRPQGDVGISQPGPAKWPTPVEKFLQNRLAR